MRSITGATSQWQISNMKLPVPRFEWGYTWDQPNVIRGDSGQKTLGTFLVQNMLLWIVPAAAEGKDLAAFSAPGGFVNRIIQAAKKP